MWSLDVISDDPEEFESVQTILRIYLLGIKAFICAGLTHVASFIGIPLMAGGRALPYKFWLPENSSFYYMTIFAIETYVVFVLLFLVCGIDSLFIALCGSMGIQFRLLAHKMRKLKGDLEVEVIKRTLKECILHQRHIIV